MRCEMACLSPGFYSLRTYTRDYAHEMQIKTVRLLVVARRLAAGAARCSYENIPIHDMNNVKSIVLSVCCVRYTQRQASAAQLLANINAN